MTTRVLAGRLGQLMTSRFPGGRMHVLMTGAVAVAALAASVALATPATAAPASCDGISFTVLHNDQSGGLILPGGSYTVSSPTRPQDRLELLHDVPEQVQQRHPRLGGGGDRQGLGNLHQERQQHAIYGQVEQSEARDDQRLRDLGAEGVARSGERRCRYGVLPPQLCEHEQAWVHAPWLSGRDCGDEQRQADR